MRKQAIRLTDLLDLHVLQSLQDSFAASMNITTMLVAPDGYPVTKLSNIRNFCRMVQQSEEGLEKCHRAHKQICDQARRKGRAVTVTCPQTGLYTAGIPVFLDHQLLGCWIVGQIRMSGMDESRVVETASGCGFHDEEIHDILSCLPVLSRQEFDNIINYFSILSNTIVYITRNNLEIRKTNAELLEMTERLDLTAQMLTKFTETTEVGICISDFFSGEILMANKKYASQFDLAADDILNKNCWELARQESCGFCEECPREELLDETGQPAGPYVWERQVPGDRWISLTHQAIYWTDGRLAHMVTFVDVTHQKMIHEQLEQLAYQDRDMALPNGLRLRRDFADMLPEEEWSLICLDILALRDVNNAYNRDVGDALLKNVRDWINNLEVEDAVLYRIGGDEFGFLLRNSRATVAAEIAKGIHTRFEEPWSFLVGGERMTLFCGVSMGMVSSSSGVGNDEDPINIVERLLETSRDTGQIAIYNEQLDQQFREHIRLELSLKQCVKEGMKGFTVHYQPIVDAVSGHWCSVEALCRWESPEFGLVPPLVFIREAEHLGLIGAIGFWVLETAVRQCKAWKLDEIDQFILDVNLSPAQLMDETLDEQILGILERYDYPGDKLSLEITESTEFNFEQRTISAIDSLRQHQIVVALDDFGTGYSSFNNLKQLPVGILKTERAFLKNIENDNYLQYLLYLMVQLAHTAGMKLVAEGVETEAQMKLLIKNNVDFLQGYLFSKPLNASELENQLDHFSKPEPLISRVRRERITIQSLLDGQSDYTMTPDIYRIFNQCMQAMLTHPTPSKGVEEALRLAARSLSLSRATLFLMEQDGFAFNCEWCQRGTSYTKRRSKSMDWENFEQFYLPEMKKDGLIAVSDLNMLPEGASKELSFLKDAKSVAIIPLWDDERPFGFASFCDCQGVREWQPSEMLMLHNLAMVAVNLLKKERLKEELSNRNMVLANVLDHMNTSVFVSDIDTGEILFANHQMRQVLGDGEPVEGRHCWEILWGEKQRCELCVMDQFRNQPDLEHLTWQYHHQVLDRSFRMHEGIIPWGNGRLAHMQYAEDMDLEQVGLRAEEYLQIFADYGDIELNHSKLLRRLLNQINRARTFGVPMTLCYVDYQPVEGTDPALRSFEVLSECLVPGDTVTRLDRTSFILVFYGSDIGAVQERILQAKIQLKRHMKKPPLIRFGAVEISETPYQDNKDYVYKLLIIARERFLALQKDTVPLKV